MGDNKRESGKWWTAAPVKYQYCIIQARFPLRVDLVLSLKVSVLSDLCPLIYLYLLIRLGLDPKLLAKILNMSSGRCWSSDKYNPVPGVMEGVPSANNYQGGFGTKLMAKVGGVSFDHIYLFTPSLNEFKAKLNKTCCVHRILVLLRTLRPVPGPRFLLVLWHTRSTAQCALMATLTKTFPPSSSFYERRRYSRSSGSDPDSAWETDIMIGWFSIDMHVCLFWKGCYRHVEANECSIKSLISLLGCSLVLTFKTLQNHFYLVLYDRFKLLLKPAYITLLLQMFTVIRFHFILLWASSEPKLILGPDQMLLEML